MVRKNRFVVDFGRKAGNLQSDIHGWGGDCIYEVDFSMHQFGDMIGLFKQLEVQSSLVGFIVMYETAISFVAR